MTVWRLPDLTGLELHEADRCVLHGVDAVSLELPDGRGYVDLPLAVLVEVKPPLPPEPPVGAYRVGDLGVLCMRVSSEPGRGWVYQSGDELFDEMTFAELCRDFGTDVVRLVEAPKPVTLPWRDGPLGVYVDPNGLGGGPHKVVVSVRGHTAHVTSLLARATAGALWAAAADVAEAQS